MGVTATNAKGFFGKNDKLPFGKYKDKTIIWIAENEPYYILWLDEKIETISIDQQIVRDCEQAIQEQNDLMYEYYSQDWYNKD